MYQLGKQTKNRSMKPYVWLGVGGVVLVVAALIVAGRMVGSHTTIVQSPGVTHVVSGDLPSNHYNEGVFALDMPTNWRFTGSTHELYNIYSWQSTEPGGANRQLDVYVDNSPQKLAVNRFLGLAPASNGLNILGQVSGNCSSFARPLTPGKGQSSVMASWQGVKFLCDVANSERNVVGAGSSGQLNGVSLVGKTTGRHSFFFTFTDRTASPSYADFYKALQSFEVK